MVMGETVYHSVSFLDWLLVVRAKFGGLRSILKLHWCLAKL